MRQNGVKAIFTNDEIKNKLDSNGFMLLQPTELIDALTEIMKLRADWYKLPQGERSEEQNAEEEDSKNA